MKYSVNGTIISLESSPVSLEYILDTSEIYKTFKETNKAIEAFSIISNVKAMESFGYKATEGLVENIANGAKFILNKIISFIKKMIEYIGRAAIFINNSISFLFNKFKTVFTNSASMKKIDKTSDLYKNIVSISDSTAKESLNTSIENDNYISYAGLNSDVDKDKRTVSENDIKRRNRVDNTGHRLDWKQNNTYDWTYSKVQSSDITEENKRALAVLKVLKENKSFQDYIFDCITGKTDDLKTQCVSAIVESLLRVGGKNISAINESFNNASSNIKLYFDKYGKIDSFVNDMSKVEQYPKNEYRSIVKFELGNIPSPNGRTDNGSYNSRNDGNFNSTARSVIMIASGRTQELFHNYQAKWEFNYDLLIDLYNNYDYIKDLYKSAITSLQANKTVLQSIQGDLNNAIKTLNTINDNNNLSDQTIVDNIKNLLSDFNLALSDIQVIIVYKSTLTSIFGQGATFIGKMTSVIRQM